MTWHLMSRAAVISLIYHALALGVFAATFFSPVPLEFSLGLLFPLFLPLGSDFAVQIVRTSFVSGVHVFLMYLALEWLLATLLIFGVLKMRARAPRQSP